MRKPIWKKADCRKTVETIAALVADQFNVAAPRVFNSADDLPGMEWEWRTDCAEVWTKAGRAELTVDVDSAFAHLYFRFDDPARAVDVFAMSRHDTRLNRHSGKWNSLEVPPNLLSSWIEELKSDFAKVAEKNPPADEVAAYRAKEAAAAAHWAAMRAELPGAVA